MGKTTCDALARSPLAKELRTYQIIEKYHDYESQALRAHIRTWMEEEKYYRKTFILNKKEKRKRKLYTHKKNLRDAVVIDFIYYVFLTRIKNK